MSASSELNISLEPHLLDRLRPLPSLLPTKLSDQLAPFLSVPAPPVIPYSTLLAISQWSRSGDGNKALTSSVPPLSPQDYTMVSLLAGTLTSPERKFGQWIPKKDPQELEAQRIKERKAITALVNGLLSIIAAGFATYWAADTAGWRNEWRVLLALFVSIIVAISEGGLYLIWQSKKNGRTTRLTRRDKKDEDSQESHLEPVAIEASSSATVSSTTNLRQRRL